LGGREEFLTRLNLASRTPEVVSVVAALLHIQDEISWGLIPEKAGSDSARRSLDGFLSTEGQEAKSRKIWFASDQGIVCSLVRFMAAISCGQGRLVRYE
jgi:hypothetical protein